jgi:hypothetical protein
MNEKDREYEHFTNIVISDEYYGEWRKFWRANSHRIPLRNGSAIRNASIELMKEFLSS